ncbi:PREDICTED: cytochrome c oxidase subunit 7B, mitochondrial [Nanorana parkeri]|uniref:cytochrome c oxidase subunit 7B, mitochondrial n=1 Tax=Nanorana parkeri TaxID=125878 RepID=UPI0008543B6B|nr:PREDICTED: cytochrome c oxidase subunit 7B, mitochondrial [Nanorana parkeri]
MFPLARSALAVSARGLQRTIMRRNHYKSEPDFHDKYGNAILASGTLFCVGIWTYVATSTGICWNLSPVGRVTPKEWKDK